MRFDIITIFPDFFGSFLEESLIKKAKDKKIIEIKIHDLRKWTTDKHHTIDSRPYGGGAGMILMVEPLVKAIKDVKQKNKKTKIVLLSPTGKQFKQKAAWRLSKVDQVLLICGRYEGVDARVEKFIDEKISIGPYVLSGGEVPAMVMVEAVSRLLPGYMGNPYSLVEESWQNDDSYEYAQYGRPEIFEVGGKKLRVPKVLLSGDHQKIKEWRKARSKKIKK